MNEFTGTSSFFVFGTLRSWIDAQSVLARCSDEPRRNARFPPLAAFRRASAIDPLRILPNAASLTMWQRMQTYQNKLMG
jgi:hypothetical protein